MSPRAHDFGTSGVLDVWRSKRQDFNPYWFPGITISWWIEFKIYSFRFGVVLFPISASGTGGSPLQIGRWTSGNGTWYSTRFWVPGTLYVSGLGKLCFPLREIDFVTENNLPARGWKTPPKSSFFTGPSVCQHRFSSGHRILAFSLEISSAEPRFWTLPHTKAGQILQDLPRFTMFLIQYGTNKQSYNFSKLQWAWPTKSDADQPFSIT